MQEIFLCSICNVSSGSCAEDCAYCTQSAKYNADIERYKFKSIEQIVFEAKEAAKNGALGFCSAAIVAAKPPKLCPAIPIFSGLTPCLIKYSFTLYLNFLCLISFMT